MNCQTAIEKSLPKDSVEVSTCNRATYSPAVDILESPDELTLYADMPGLQAKDVDIEFENGQLTVRGAVAPRGPKDARYLRREYGIGGFERSFRIGDTVDSEHISAEYADGVLTVHLPKVAAARPRQIEVTGA